MSCKETMTSVINESGKERLELFRMWRYKQAIEPWKYRVVRMDRDVGTFGIEQWFDTEWVLIDHLSPWEVVLDDGAEINS